MLRSFQRASQEVIEEMSATDADFKRVRDSYSDFRAKYAEWARISRLPPGFGAAAE